MSDNPDHALHRSRNRSNAISSDAQLALLLSRSLDVLGYNHDMIKHRIDYYKLKESIEHHLTFPFHEGMYAGSRKEGVVAPFESDTDRMSIPNTVICADNVLPFMHFRNIHLFQTDSRDTEPGYTKLKLINITNDNPFITESLFQSDNGVPYISSEFYTNIIMKICMAIQTLYTVNIPRLSKAGPAVPVYLQSTPGILHDLVSCFKCYCPALLQSWLRRPRRYNWPSQNMLYHISQMEAHVVPVGCKGSDTYYQEWRLCFTKAEIHLIHSLNDTQIKLYVILKMVAKTVLKIICPEITSYIIKNITLWMCESTPPENFTEHQLLNSIFHALEFLRKCVAQNNLPSYMIPERNLFHGRIELRQKCELIDSLSSFIDKRPAALFHGLDKICGAMSLLYQEPQNAGFFMLKKNTVEKLYLLRVLRHQLIASPGMTKEEHDQVILQDELNRNLNKALLNLVVPELLEIPNVSVICDIYNERVRHILS